MISELGTYHTDSLQENASPETIHAQIIGTIGRGGVIEKPTPNPYGVALVPKNQNAEPDPRQVYTLLKVKGPGLGIYDRMTHQVPTGTLVLQSPTGKTIKLAYNPKAATPKQLEQLIGQPIATSVNVEPGPILLGEEPPKMPWFLAPLIGNDPKGDALESFYQHQRSLPPGESRAIPTKGYIVPPEILGLFNVPDTPVVGIPIWAPRP